MPKPEEKSLQGAEITVPGSIANLGPGFDTLAVAVRLYLRVRVAAVTAPGGGRLEFNFIGSRLDGENLIERAFRLLALQDGRDFPSMRLRVRSEIPMRSGLGSSSAAIVAGLRLYEKVFGPQPQQRLLEAACEIEGHPDNVAAALLGGLTGSCRHLDGSVTALASRWPASLRFVVVTPEVRLGTEASRQVLPESVSREDAVFNLQRVVLLLQALQQGNYALLREALRDRWHQPYREPLVPGMAQALALEHPDLLGVCLSGSGPSVAALSEGNFSAIEALLLQSYQALGIPCQVRTLRVHQKR